MADITKEQAIEHLKFYKDTLPKEPPIECVIDHDEHNWYHDNEIHHKALDMAIQSLEKLEKIEQIVKAWNNDASHSFEDMCKINGILKE